MTIDAKYFLLIQFAMFVRGVQIIGKLERGEKKKILIMEPKRKPQ